MANYTEIASEVIERSREDGSLDRYEFVIEERDGDSDDLGIPIVDKPMIEHGSEQDGILKPIKSCAMTFRIKDKSGLADRLRNAGKKQFKVVVTELESGYIEFEGFIHPDQHSYSRFKKVRTLDLKASGHLTDAKRAGVSDTDKLLSEHYEDWGDVIDLPRLPDFYTRWQHEGESLSDCIAAYLQCTDAEIIGGQDGSRLDALRYMSRQFGFQVFQRNGRLAVAEAAELGLHPDSVNSYINDGSGGFTQESNDFLISLDKSNVLDDVTGEGEKVISKITQQMAFTGRSKLSISSLSDVTLETQGDEETVPYTGVAVEGDYFSPDVSGELRVDAGTGGLTGTLKYLKVVFESLVGGPTLYHDFDTGEWSEDEDHAEIDFDFDDSAGTQSWSRSFDTDKIPEGEAGVVKIICTFDFTASGDGSRIDENFVDSASAEHTYSDAELADYFHRWEASITEEAEELAHTMWLADVDQFNNDQAFQVDPDGIFQAADEFVDDDGNGQLGEIAVRRKAKLALGSGDDAMLPLRATQRVTFLNTFDLTEDGQTQRYRPCYIQHDLLGGYYDIRLKPVRDESFSEDDFYSTESAQATDGGSTSGVEEPTGSPSSNGRSGHHPDLTGLDNPDDHPWAAQVDLTNIDWEEVDKSDVRDNLSVYSKQEADDKFIEDDELDIQGTNNQVIVSEGDGEYVFVLSTPQDIHQSATPTWNQNILNSAPSEDNHSVRAGKEIKTSDPLSGGDKLLNLIDLKLKYNSTNLKITDGELNTIQDIHEDADMILKTLFLKEGLTLDDEDGYVDSETFSEGFAGEGTKLEKVNGNWRLTVDELVTRKLARFYEIAVERVRANGGTIVVSPGAEKAATVTENDSFYDTVIGNSSEVIGQSDKYFIQNWTVGIEDDKLLTVDEYDLLWRQQWNGRGTGITEATVLETEGGSVDPEDNSTPRTFTIYTEDGSQDPEAGMEFAVIGNKTDAERQNCIIITASDVGNPYTRYLTGIDSHDAFGNKDNIIGQQGRIGNMDMSHIWSDLDGSNPNEMGTFWQGNIYINDGHFRGRIEITDPDNSNAATKGYVDDAVGQGEGSVTIRSDSEPTERESGAGLAEGDIWIDTSDGDKPYTYDGSDWIRAYTSIGPGILETGAVVIDNLDFQEGGRIKGDYLKITGDTEFEEDVQIRGELTAEVGGELANFEVMAGMLASKLNENDIREVEILSGGAPGMHLTSPSGNEELWVGGTYSFDPENDVSVADTDFSNAAGDHFVSASADSSDPQDSDRFPSSGYEEGEYEIDTQYNGRQIRYTTSYRVEENTSSAEDENGNEVNSFANAEVELEIQLLDSSDDVVESQSMLKTGNEDSQISILIRIPDDSDTYTVKYRFYIYANADATSYVAPNGQTAWLTASAEADIESLTDPLTILGINEFVSPLGGSWVNESTGHRAYIRRENGELLGNKHTIEDVDTGDQAWLDISNGYVRLMYDGGEIISWEID